MSNAALYDPEELAQLRAEVSRLRAAALGAAEPALTETVHALEIAEARHRSVLASMSEGVVVHASDGQIVSCNRAAEEILGLTVDQMAGRTSMDPRWQAIHEDGTTFEGTSHPAMITLRSGQPQRNVLMGVKRPEGTLSWISINSQPLVGADGESRGVVATFTDITEKKAALEALEESEERLRLALSAARIGTWSWAVPSGEIRWSDQIADILSIDLSDFDGTFEGYLALVHPDDRAAVQRTIRQTLDSPQLDQRYHVEHRIFRKDGSIAWIQGYGSVLRDETGRATGMIGATIDVTDRKGLEAQLLHAQKMESVGRLAGGVAHDFNNMITAVLGSAELAEMHADGNPQLVRHLKAIQDGAERAGELTRKLLTFARRQVLEVRPVEPARLVGEMEPLLRRLIGEDIELVVDLQTSGRVRADPTQLEQVVVNLVINARDAMPQGGRLAIRVDERSPTPGEAHLFDLPTGRWVALEVRDQGIGMDEAHLSRICEPFFTTKEHGTGLGLATSHGIVAQLGGRIVFSSTPQVGTTATVLLPRQQEGESDAPASTGTVPAGGPETILVVEDEVLVREVAIAFLENAGYEVLGAGSGEEALGLFSRYGDQIDLMISDVILPGMNGAELVRRLRESQPEIKVMLVSGYHGAALRERGVLPEDVSLLPKPYSPRQLAARVRETLDHSSE